MHVGQSATRRAAGRAGAADAVVRDGHVHARRTVGAHPLAGFNAYDAGPRVGHHVGNCLLADAQHVQEPGGAQPLDPRQLPDPPVKAQALPQQLRLQSPAQRAQQRGYVVDRGIHRVDHQPHVGQRPAQPIRNRPECVALLFEGDQGRHQLAAHAVVHLAHDSLALDAHYPLVLEHAQATVVALQLGALVVDLLLEIHVGRCSETVGLGKAHQQGAGKAHAGQRAGELHDPAPRGRTQADLYREVVAHQGHQQHPGDRVNHQFDGRKAVPAHPDHPQAVCRQRERPGVECTGHVEEHGRRNQQRRNRGGQSKQQQGALLPRPAAVDQVRHREHEEHRKPVERRVNEVLPGPERQRRKLQVVVKTDRRPGKSDQGEVAVHPVSHPEKEDDAEQHDHDYARGGAHLRRCYLPAVARPEHRPQLAVGPQQRRVQAGVERPAGLQSYVDRVKRSRQLRRNQRKVERAVPVAGAGLHARAEHAKRPSVDEHRRVGVHPRQVNRPTLAGPADGTLQLEAVPAHPRCSRTTGGPLVGQRNVLPQRKLRWVGGQLVVGEHEARAVEDMGTRRGERCRRRHRRQAAGQQQRRHAAGEKRSYGTAPGQFPRHCPRP